MRSALIVYAIILVGFGLALLCAALAWPQKPKIKPLGKKDLGQYH